MSLLQESWGRDSEPKEVLSLPLVSVWARPDTSFTLPRVRVLRRDPRGRPSLTRDPCCRVHPHLGWTAGTQNGLIAPYSCSSGV